MAQLIKCPECQKPLQVPEDLLGTTVQCPECKNTFTASATGSGAPPADAEPPADKKPRVKKRSRPEIDEDDDDDDDDRRDMNIDRRRREKPSKVTSLGVMALIGGIEAILVFLIGGGTAGAFSFGICCLWPGWYYSLVVGIFAVIKGSSLLSGDASSNSPPTGIAILMIINIINADVVGCILGIVMLVFCGDEEVKDYLAK
jgi:uncharacterized Zn finger protein (UPF0148 family)